MRKQLSKWICKVQYIESRCFHIDGSCSVAAANGDPEWIQIQKMYIPSFLGSCIKMQGRPLFWPCPHWMTLLQCTGHEWSLNENGVNYMPWPSQPSWTPMGDSGAATETPSTKHQIIECFDEEWCHIPPIEFQTLVESVTRCIEGEMEILVSCTTECIFHIYPNPSESERCRELP